MNLSQLAWVWVAQKPWLHCLHSLCDSHVAHTEHSHSLGSLPLASFRVLRAPESPGRARRVRGRGAKSQTLSGILSVLRKASRVW